MTIQLPYLIFLADVQDPSFAKTAYGLRDWRPDACIGQWGLPECQVDLGLSVTSPALAATLGAKSMLIGVATVGGRIQDHWVPAILEAIDAGLDIVSGMHSKLEDIEPIRIAAAAKGVALHNVRHPGTSYPVGTGRKRTGKRLLAVGSDCALGKKYTTLALAKAFQDVGHKATFRATGQTGIMISGNGIPIDAVVSDFLAGAAESLSPDNDDDHWDIIEGQGSIIHPGYASVTLGLLHGSQPDILIMCHDPRRNEIDEYPGFAIPPLDELMDLILLLAKRTNPHARFAAIALNTSSYDDEERTAVLKDYSDRYRLPAFDPMKSDLDPIVKAATG